MGQVATTPAQAVAVATNVMDMVPVMMANMVPANASLVPATGMLMKIVMNV